jgi:hypothetical protein
MPQSTLLVFPKQDDTAAQNAFSWDHAMAHRSLMAVMGPLTQWSGMPYFIDPTNFSAGPAVAWNQGHQQAHDDFNSYLPAYYNAPPPPGPPPLGLHSRQPLMDTDFQRGEISWWTFANHQEHYAAAKATQPLPTGANIPWWAQPPRRVQTYW